MSDIKIPEWTRDRRLKSLRAEAMLFEAMEEYQDRFGPEKKDSKKDKCQASGSDARILKAAKAALDKISAVEVMVSPLDGVREIRPRFSDVSTSTVSDNNAQAKSPYPPCRYIPMWDDRYPWNRRNR